MKRGRGGRSRGFILFVARGGGGGGGDEMMLGMMDSSLLYV